MALFNRNKGLQSKTDVQLNRENSPSQRVEDTFYRFGRTDFALNNLFLFDDSINGGDKPLFYLRGTFPWAELGVFNHHHGNSFEYFPDTEDVNQFEVEFYETSDSRCFDYFEEWRNLIHHDNGTYNLPAVFKKDLNVYRTEAKTGDPEGGMKKVFGFKYENVFPVKISEWQPDYSDSNIVVFTVTFSADNVKRLTGEDGIRQPYVVDPEALWAAAKANMDYNIGATRSDIESRKSNRERIADALNLKKKINAGISKTTGLPPRAVSKLQTKTGTVATSLFFSKGRNFTNLGF